MIIRPLARRRSVGGPRGDHRHDPASSHTTSVAGQTVPCGRSAAPRAARGQPPQRAVSSRLSVGLCQRRRAGHTQRPARGRPAHPPGDRGVQPPDGGAGHAPAGPQGASPQDAGPRYAGLQYVGTEHAAAAGGRTPSARHPAAPCAEAERCRGGDSSVVGRAGTNVRGFPDHHVRADLPRSRRSTVARRPDDPGRRHGATRTDHG
jgi:hypothetical protein